MGNTGNALGIVTDPRLVGSIVLRIVDCRSRDGEDEQQNDWTEMGRLGLDAQAVVSLSQCMQGNKPLVELSMSSAQQVKDGTCSTQHAR